MKAEFISRKDVLKGLRVVTQLTFEVDRAGEIPQFCELTISKQAPKRNLNQNDYFHEVCGEIAKLISSSKTEVKNWLLNDYGEYKTDGNGNPIAVLMPMGYPYEKDDELHLCPTGETIEGYEKYYQLLNSSAMNTKQFGRLLEGALYELENLKE